MASLTLDRIFSGTRTNGHRARPIICGVDGSRVACEALRRAQGLADALDLPLVAAHVVGPAPTPAASDDLASGETLLEQACLAAEVSDADRRIVAGRPAERLAELADEENAELIVVGSRGHRLLRAASVGGVSSELIGLASCPVLVIPAPAVPWETAS